MRGTPVTIEVRSCKDKEEVDQYGKVVSYVFAEDDKDALATEMSGTQPDWTTCAWVDGKIATTMGTFPFTVRLNGAPVHMGGVTAVGTLPQHRRKGLLRQVMGLGFQQMRERGQSIAILWASMGAIYQRFGYGGASSSVGYSFDPRFAGFAFPQEPTGTVELMDKEEAYPFIKQLYIQFATPRNLHIHRSSILWNVGTLRPPKKDQPVYIGVYRNSDGEARGHIVYSTQNQERTEPGPSQVLNVSDFVWLDTDAFRGLWEYTRRHDLVGRVNISGAFGEDDPARDLLMEPRMLNRKVNDGIWMRIVDLEKAIPERPYGGRGALVFEIQGDSMCDWNEGTWEMETGGESTEIRRSTRQPQLTMPINSLATLMAGYRSATHLARNGLIAAHDERALKVADDLFRTEYFPNCPNGF
jgi:predicted acetyltransferase